MEPKSVACTKTEITYCDIFPEFFFRGGWIIVDLEYTREVLTTAAT